MGFFENKEETKTKLAEAHKYVKTIHVNSNKELDIAIADEMKTRIIKDIQYQYVETSNSCTYSVMIIYDTWAEKARNEKENSKEMEL